MTSDQYLENVLSQQRLTSTELDELRAHRADVQTVLEQHFSDRIRTSDTPGPIRRRP